MMEQVQRLAPGHAIDNSPRSLEDDFEPENEALSTKARKVIECMQRRWLNATFCQWADRAQTRSTDGVAEGPVIMIVKKANSAVQRSARPDAVQPDEESMKERDEHAALEEMGTTMRVQQEQIERLKQEAKDVNMRFIAKEYQWKEEKAMLQSRIELFKQKFERQEATLAVANEIQAKHSEAVGSQAQLFLLGQAMRDAMQDSEIHMDQMSSTIDWLEQIVESCHADTLHQQHKLKNLERNFGTPAEERVQRLEASVSKQCVMLQELQTENAHLKVCVHNLEVQSMTRNALLEGEEQVRKQLRAKHEENERLLKILHDMDATLAKKGIVKEAVGIQQATMLEHMHSEIALISMEREVTEILLKDAIAKNDDLESLTSQLHGILRYLQEKRSMRRVSMEDGSPLRCITSPKGPPVAVATRTRELLPLVAAATRSAAPPTPYVGPIALSLPDPAPLLTDYGGGAVFVAGGNKDSAASIAGAGDTTPRAAVSTHKGGATRSAMLPPAGEAGSSVRHQSMLPEAHDPVWPTVTRSPHISNMPPVVWSEEVVAPETIAAQKSNMQPSLMFGYSIKQANPAVASIGNQDSDEKQLEPVHGTQHWRPGRDYPAAPPIAPIWTADLLPQMPRGTGREPDRTGRGSAHEVCAREASQRRKAVGHSPFTSLSLIHSRAPTVPLIEIEPALHLLLATPQRVAPSPLLQSSPRGQRAVNQFDATPPEFGLSAEIIYNTVDTHWANFVQRQTQSFTASPNGVNSHRDPFSESANGAEVQQASATAQRPASPMHERAYSPMPQRASSPAMQRASSSTMQRSAPPPPAPVPMMQRSAPPPPAPVPTTPKQGNDSNSVLSHPMLGHQFAHFLDEQRKKGGLSGNISDIHWALRIGQDRAGEQEPPGTAVPEGTGTGGGLSSESAHVIAREIARLQASRAEDAERLKALTQRRASC